MAFLFGGGRKVEADGGVRECARQVGRNVRGTERELERAEAREKGLMRELKRCAGDLPAARLKATELVRLRAHKGRLASLRANMTGLAQELEQVGASQRTQDMVGRTALMLGKLNSRMDPTGAARLVAIFERESAQMGVKQEVLHEALDSAFEAEGEAALTDAAVEQVLAEAGLEEGMRYARARAGEDPSMVDLERAANS